jgi:hypothetical protein
MRQAETGNTKREGECMDSLLWRVFVNKTRSSGNNLIHPLPLYYLTILYQLHCLTAVNYVHWFPWLNYSPWLQWLKNESNYVTHCCTSMGSTMTRQWCGYHDHETIYGLTLSAASFASTSEVWSSKFRKGWSYGISTLVVSKSDLRFSWRRVFWLARILLTAFPPATYS